VQVMVDIVADAQRLNRSRSEFAEIFGLVERAFPEALKELKGSRIFYGRGGWRDVPPELRKDVFRRFCEWICERKHLLAISAIDIGRFGARLPDDYPHALRDLWVAGALHIALQLQKLHQTARKNKGHTVLIFDENKAKADRLNEVLFAPPAWTEAYYNKRKKQVPLDQIIDSAFFTKSHTLASPKWLICLLSCFAATPSLRTTARRRFMSARNTTSTPSLSFLRPG
jgi:hypothetical protein